MYQYLTLEQQIAYLKYELELLKFDFRLPICEVYKRANLLSLEIERLENVLREQRRQQAASEVVEWVSKQNYQSAVCNAVPQDKRLYAEFAFDINGIIDTFNSPPQSLLGQILAVGSIVHTVGKYAHKAAQQMTA